MSTTYVKKLGSRKFAAMVHITCDDDRNKGLAKGHRDWAIYKSKRAATEHAKLLAEKLDIEFNQAA